MVQQWLIFSNEFYPFFYANDVCVEIVENWKETQSHIFRREISRWNVQIPAGAYRTTSNLCNLAGTFCTYIYYLSLLSRASSLLLSSIPYRRVSFPNETFHARRTADFWRMSHHIFCTQTYNNNKKNKINTLITLFNNNWLTVLCLCA